MSDVERLSRYAMMADSNANACRVAVRTRREFRYSDASIKEAEQAVADWDAIAAHLRTSEPTEPRLPDGHTKITLIAVAGRPAVHPAHGPGDHHIILWPSETGEDVACIDCIAEAFEGDEEHVFLVPCVRHNRERDEALRAAITSEPTEASPDWSQIADAIAHTATGTLAPQRAMEVVQREFSRQASGTRIEGLAHRGEHFWRVVENDEIAQGGYGVLLDFVPAAIIIYDPPPSPGEG